MNYEKQNKGKKGVWGKKRCHVLKGKKGVTSNVMTIILHAFLQRSREVLIIQGFADGTTAAGVFTPEEWYDILQYGYVIYTNIFSK